MPSRHVPRTILLAALGWMTVSGCASFGPAPLLEEAGAAYDGGDVAGAYARLKEIRTRHPHSREADEAFPLAARSFRQLWWGRRMADQLDSPWVRSEQAFMFDWLASYCGHDEFPEERMANLFRGMPAFFFADFLAYGAIHAELSRWDIHAEEDDGRVVRLRGQRRAERTADGAETGESGSEGAGHVPES
jgi:hypothetical protein